VGLHIAGTAGIGIIAPHATDIIRTLENYKIFNAFLSKSDGSADPAEAAADDCYLKGLHL
jgi:hypothetical protein